MLNLASSDKCNYSTLYGRPTFSDKPYQTRLIDPRLVSYRLIYHLTCASFYSSDRSAVLVQERAQRLAGVAALPGGLFHLDRLALVVGNQFLEFFKCHTLPPQDILPQDTPSQALKQPITQPLS